jgi:uncharacterized circularly permuted ATP-grasp superfamily protein/uncharacterized alpha-E superfamily protein
LSANLPTVIPGVAAPAGTGIDLTGYRASAGAYDELIAPDGSVREHWRPLVAALERLGPSATSAASERIQRRIVENGLTLDSFSDPLQADQPWKLDFVPLILPDAEWQALAKAAIQRARLGEALLADLYGPQKVLSEGILPPELIFSDPSFLRPLHGMAGDVPPRLFFMAMDVARGHTGAWHVIDTHAETIAGHGYALANRIVLAEVSPRLFRDCNVRRLSQFYQDIATGLAMRAGVDYPTIAILGPDPDDDTYLSHAYMARYLGYQLLQGSDLRVVGGKVFHKTLAGLQSIDLIVRAVAAASADPLELDPNGFDGPPAFVQAVREKPGLVANALGTAIIENRGLGPFQSKLMAHLLGEAPLIADANRTWLGDPAAREALFANPGDALLREAFEGPARPGHARLGQDLSAMTPEHRAELEAEVALNGARYVAEHPVEFATMPSWSAGRLRPRPYAVRIFVAHSGDGYTVMPGGLALAIDSGAAVALSSQSAESHDVWISSTEPQGPHFSRWRLSEEESQVQRLGTRLPSRVADNMFWLGRYVERADWTLRVMRNALHRGEEDLRPVRRTDAAENALDTLIMKGRTPGIAGGEYDGADIAPTLEKRVETLFAGANMPYGIRTTFQHIRRVARQSRDRLSADAWRVLGGLTIAHNPAIDPSSDLVDRLDRRITQLAAFNGLMHENMTRNYGWLFLDLGRRIERAQQIAELLRSLLIRPNGEVDETERLAFLLETTDSFMTYRARYRFAPTFPLVLDLLMIDEMNPRGLAFQLLRIADHIADFPKASLDAVRTPEQRLALELLTLVRLADLDSLRSISEDGRRAALGKLLDKLIGGLPDLSDIVSRRYFSLTEELPHRVHMRLAP